MLLLDTEKTTIYVERKEDLISFITKKNGSEFLIKVKDAEELARHLVFLARLIRGEKSLKSDSATYAVIDGDSKPEFFYSFEGEESAWSYAEDRMENGLKPRIYELIYEAKEVTRPRIELTPASR